MAQETQEHATHPARARSETRDGALSVTTPSGWAFEQLVLTSRGDPATLDVRSERAQPAEALSAFANRRARTLAEQFGGYAEESARIHETRSHDVFVRRFSWGWEEEGRREGAEACRLAGERAVVATLLSTGALAPGAEESLAGLLAEFSLHDDVPEVTRIYAVEELAAIAELVGTATYPGTGDHRLESPAERLTARRSLVARGTIGGDGNGGLAVDPLERKLLGAPLAAGAVVSVERRAPGARETRVFHVTPTLTVMQAGSGSGLHRLTGFPTTGLVRRLGEFTRLDDRDVAAGEATSVDREAFEQLVTEALAGRPAAGELAGPLAALRGVCTIRLLRREGTRHLGGTVRWLDAGAEGLWLLEADSTRLRVQPASSADVLQRLRALMS